MELLGMPLNKRMAIWFGLHGLIIVDIVLITIAMLFVLPQDVTFKIQIFDFIVCIILLGEWCFNFYLSKPKTTFLKQKDNIISLIASIPFDVILPAVIPGVGLLRYLRLLKLLRIIALFNRLFEGVSRFISKTNLDKIIGGLIFTILIFTVLMWIFGPSYDLFDDFYFVVVTLTTVGYGDVTPKTFNEKVIAILLIFVGIFVFSTITAAISSFLTERLLEDGEGDIKQDIENMMSKKFEAFENELQIVHEENKVLQEENKLLQKGIEELKELIEENK